MSPNRVQRDGQEMGRKKMGRKKTQKAQRESGGESTPSWGTFSWPLPFGRHFKLLKCPQKAAFGQKKVI